MSAPFFSQAMFSMPKQMLLKTEKDEDWRKKNMDYWEMLGVHQLQSQFRRLSKNVRMAKGKVDPRDYGVGGDNIDSAYASFAGGTDDFNVASIKSFPLASNFINTMVGEFAKLKEEVIFKSVDKYGKSEVLSKRKNDVIESIVGQAKSDFVKKLQEQGIQPTEEMMSQADQQVRSLPEIQKYYTSEYRDTLELWATGQDEYNTMRFDLREKEINGFEDSLTMGKEFWHIRLRETDYNLYLESPLNTFAIKSPETRLVADGLAAGVVKMLTVSEVLNDWGDKMTEKQMLDLDGKFKEAFGTLGNMGYGPWENYDPSKPRAQQITNLDVNRNNYFMNWAMANPNADIWSATVNQNLMNPFDFPGMVRVTEVYWKSQRRVGFLTKINSAGNTTRAIVSEEYIVFDKPVYNSTQTNKKDESSLIFGEHIEWKWVPEVWRGVKIGGNFGMPQVNSNPIYLDVEPLIFQFRDKDNIFDVKLPIQGCDFADRNGESSAPMDRMRPYQVAYDLVMNKIVDIEIDELGSFVTFNKNILPKHSLGQSWEQEREMKAMDAIRYYKLLPIDKSLDNLGGERVFGDEVRVVDASETNRSLGKIQIAGFLQQQAWMSVGFNPQRFGQASEYQSADGQRQSVTASYSQTDRYFHQHSNYLMPKVREQLIWADMIYNYKRGGNAKVAFLNDKFENQYFEAPEQDMLRQIGCFALTTPDLKEVKSKMEQFVFTNGSQGVTVFDVSRILQAKTPLQIEDALKEAQARAEQQAAQQRQAELAALQEQLASQERQTAAALQQKSEQQAADRQNSRYVADRQNQDQSGNPEDTSMKDKELTLKNDIENRKLDVKEREIAAKSQQNVLSSQTSLANPVAGEKNNRPQIKI